MFRTRDTAGLYAHPRDELKRLTDRGLLVRLRPGLYAIVHPGEHGSTWRPELEATAGAVAAALCDVEATAVMGVSAARVHRCNPRTAHDGRRRSSRAACTDPARRPRCRGIHLVPSATSPASTSSGRRPPSGTSSSPPSSRPRSTWRARPDLGGAPDEARAAARLLVAGPAVRSDGTTSAPTGWRRSPSGVRRYPDDAAVVAAAFGADVAQVAHDRLVSELLAAICEHLGDDVVFFGGTALARTYLPNGRLSEDIDLLATTRRRDVAAALDALLSSGLRRRVGRAGPAHGTRPVGSLGPGGGWARSTPTRPTCSPSFGPTARRPQAWMFDQVPGAKGDAGLAAQTTFP